MVFVILTFIATIGGAIFEVKPGPARFEKACFMEALLDLAIRSCHLYKNYLTIIDLDEAVNKGSC